MNSIDILFCGDFSSSRRFGPVVTKRQQLIFEGLQDEINKSDIAILNLESPLKAGRPLKKSGPCLAGVDACAPAIACAGFDLVGLANNHIMDYGSAGLERTISVLGEHGLRTFGAGKDLFEAQQVTYLERGGMRMAFIAIAEQEFNIAGRNSAGAAPLDVVDNAKQIKIAKENADYIFIFLHGGNEFFSYPRPGLKKVCRFFVDCGADAVICHHTHVVGPYEVYKNSPIFYGLGNLLFDHPMPPQGWNIGYSVMLSCGATAESRSCNFSIIPHMQSLESGGIRLLEGLDRDKFFVQLHQMVEDLQKEEIYLSHWNDFCRQMENEVLLRQYSPVLFKGIGRLTKALGLKKVLVPQASLLRRINALRCDSHRELLLSVMERR